MSEAEQTPQVCEDEEPEETPGYKPPAQKTLEEIQQLDAEDESLQRYKAALLGGATACANDGGPNVLVETLVFAVEGRDDIKLDLTGDLSILKDKPIIIKEGTEYKLHIIFKVKREIVSGLRYFHSAYRKGIRVEKVQYMVGSYGPKAESQTYITPIDEAPKGIIARGHYTVKSRFTDDDKNSILEWEWAFDIKKDWDQKT